MVTRYLGSSSLIAVSIALSAVGLGEQFGTEHKERAVCRDPSFSTLIT